MIPTANVFLLDAIPKKVEAMFKQALLLALAFSIPSSAWKQVWSADVSVTAARWDSASQLWYLGIPGSHYSNPKVP